MPDADLAAAPAAPARAPDARGLTGAAGDGAAGAAAGWYALGCREPAPAWPAPDGGARLEAFACVVGGGLAGLQAALSLLERGPLPGPVVLLEAGDGPGGGASGRNGGLASAGFTRGAESLARTLGEGPARALHGLSREGLALVRARVAAHGIACDPVDGLVIASLFEGEAALRAGAESHNRRFGGALEARSRAWVRERYLTDRYTAGLFDPEGFHLDPLALARGLARAAVAAGLLAFARSPAAGLAPEPGGEPGSRGWRVRIGAGAGAAGGEVRARHVVLATSAYGDALWPPLRRALLPVLTYVIATAPLGGRLRDAVRAPYAVYDDRFATGYYRPLPGGRLLWGGRVAARGRPPRDLPGLMRRDLAFVYPQLAGAPVEAAWAGRMGFARHKMPILGGLAPGLWASTAYGGHGLNGTAAGGELLARAILEGDPAIAAFAAFPAAPAFGALGRLAARATYGAYTLRDAARLRLPRRRRAEP